MGNRTNYFQFRTILFSLRFPTMKKGSTYPSLDTVGSSSHPTSHPWDLSI